MKRLILTFSAILISSLIYGTELTNLRCEYRVNPLGIDVTIPRLSWEINSNVRSQKQTAYRIIVASTPQKLARNKADLWNSGKVESDQSTQIEYKGIELKSRNKCYWKVEIWDKDGNKSAWSKVSHWSMGLLSQSDDWSAQWIGVDQSTKTDYAIPRYIRKEFESKGAVERATVYVTALGLYELHLNGKVIGDHKLAPEWTNYHKRVQYQCFDVTNLVSNGKNAVGAVLANGWYCGGWQFWENKLKPIYGTEPYLLVQLEIEYKNGTKTVINSDKSWKGTCDGAYRFAGIYEGVTYDARKESLGWDKENYGDADWSSVKSIDKQPQTGKLVWQRNEPIKETKQLEAIKITEPIKGIYVVDFGQNIAGTYKINIKGESGDTVTILQNEVLNPDGTLYMNNLHAGHLSSGDRQIDRYICKGDSEKKYFQPDFTYHGFRYIELHGMTYKPNLEDVKAIVLHSGFDKSGDFECSNPLINKLADNIEWSQRGNFVGVPTDCCQRDERCGYTGDANFFMGTAIYNFDVAAFFNKWLVDVCEDSQMPGGWFADHAPYYGPGPGPNVGWSDAGIFCPYIIYRTYGDKRVIEEHYAAMKRCIEWQITNARNSENGVLSKVGNGDWLNLGGGASNEVIATSHYVYSLQLMSEMAQAIDENSDAAYYHNLAEESQKTFAEHLINSDGEIYKSSQTGYALAFTMNLIPDTIKSKVAKHFVNEINRHNGHLATGFIGTPRLLPALHFAGEDKVAYSLLLNEDYPSWLFPIKNGATTIWERWDGYHPEKGFQDSGMNSFNHYSFGAVGEYLYKMVGGINEMTQGFQKILIKPVVETGLSMAKTIYRSHYGMIATSWQIEGDKLYLDVTIPVNCTANICVPAKDTETITESGIRADKATGVKLLGAENGYVIYETGSGTYRFVSKIISLKDF